MRHKLLFIKPVIQKGVAQATVRRGKKWLKATSGDVLEICDTADPDKVLYVAQVIRTTSYEFTFLPIQVLFMEHDPQCHSAEGLFKAMTEAYPDFGLHDMVTVVTFVVPE